MLTGFQGPARALASLGDLGPVCGDFEGGLGPARALGGSGESAAESVTPELPGGGYSPSAPTAGPRGSAGPGGAVSEPGL